MTASTPTSAPAPPASRTASTTTTPHSLGLEARLAAVEAAMTVRLDEAAVAYEVRTAHISTTPVDLADVITVPSALPDWQTAPATPPATYRTPVAALLDRAQHRMTVGGWCSGALTDPNGAVCMMGAIRAEAAGDRGLEADALSILRDALQRRFGSDSDGISVPDFNDAHGSGRQPARMLGEAASLADARGQ
ncbi:hypothetical protein OG604_48145 [Streptomyces sp. NBC_01231]|nr:hypothetical protein OG604_48145 [Streptomyces sp. NBC_01231]